MKKKARKKEKEKEGKEKKGRKVKCLFKNRMSSYT